MANVKISNLPAETDINNILGFAGYNAGGTCKISGADLINTLPSSTPTLGDVLTAGDEAIDQQIVFKPTTDVRVLKLDKGGLQMSNDNVDLGIIHTGFGRIFIATVDEPIVLQSIGTGSVVFNTPEIKLQSCDVLDSTSSAGSAGEVLSSLGAGNGTEWITAGGSTPTLQQVLDTGNTADSNGNTGTIVLTNSAQGRTATYGNENITADYSFGVDVTGANNAARMSTTDGDVSIQAQGTGKFIILNGRVEVNGQSNHLDPGSGNTSTWSLINGNYLLDGYNNTSGAGGDIRINSRGSLTMHTGNLSTTTPGGPLSIFARGNTASLSTIDGTTVGGDVTISSSSGDVIIEGAGLGVPAQGDVLSAKNGVTGELEWVAPGGGGKMVSVASFQGWKEATTNFGAPMAVWGSGGSGTGGLKDLGFWVAPFACTVQSFEARWGHNSPFNNGGNNPVVGLYKITNAAWTGALDIGNSANWGSALQSFTIPNTGVNNDYWKLTSTGAAVSLAAGDAIAIFMDATPTGGSDPDSVIWLYVNYTYS